jgi:hypothetical protein
MPQYPTIILPEGLPARPLWRAIIEVHRHVSLRGGGTHCVKVLVAAGPTLCLN